MRQEILLNEKWTFHKGDIKTPFPVDKGPVYSQSKVERKRSGPAAYDYPDTPDLFFKDSGLKWEYVNLPHDYVYRQNASENENNALGYFHYDNAWYRKHFTLPENSENKRILIRFDGIAGNSTVYLNGRIEYHNFSRYNTFEIDVTNDVYFDKPNVLAVYVNTEEFEGWWYQGGGIYRDVYLTVTEPIAIDLWGVYAPYKKINETDFEINFETTVINDSYEDKNLTVKSYVSDSFGNDVADVSADFSVNEREKTVVKYSAVVKNPLLWDTENPNLYRVKTVIIDNGKEIDEYNTRIGFRTVEITAANGLLINGKKTFINGVCSHQDFGLTGLAVTKNIADYKISLLKKMGANGYRTSHYMQTKYYLDACDEQGLLVMDETRTFQTSKESLEYLETLVKRDRNRPSVIFWSTGNEEPTHIDQNGEKTQRAMYSFIKKLDSTRYILTAEDKSPEKSTVYQYCDVAGINYNLANYDAVHSNHPKIAVVASECCATGTTRDWNFEEFGNERFPDIDRTSNTWYRSREETWKFLTSKPYVIGGYQWIGIDHRGEAAWPALSSKSGAIDMFLNKKGAFYQNQSYWTNKPMAHIVPHWNFEGLEGEKIKVAVYTNCEKIDLFLNKKLIATKSLDKYDICIFEVPYEKGKISVTGYENGKAVCTDTRVTTGKPVALKLTKLNEFSPNGEDIALFLCECTDENGRVVNTANEYVKFAVNSPNKIIGTGSDNCDKIRTDFNERKMYMGKITVAVKPDKNVKSVELIAQSDNCSIAKIICNFGDK